MEKTIKKLLHEKFFGINRISQKNTILKIDIEEDYFITEFLDNHSIDYLVEVKNSFGKRIIHVELNELKRIFKRRLEENGFEIIL